LIVRGGTLARLGLARCYILDWKNGYWYPSSLRDGEEGGRWLPGAPDHLKEGLVVGSL